MREWDRLSFGSDTRGVSQVIGAILLFGMLMLALTTYQVQVVPLQNTQMEFDHQQTVHDDFVDFRNSVFTAATHDEPQTSSIDLGTRYRFRTVSINPPPAAGRIQTSEPHNITFQNQQTCAADEVPTRFVEYQPAYSELQSGSIWYENSIVYQDDRSRAGLNVLEDQNIVVDGRPVRPMAVQNDLQESGLDAETIELYIDDDSELDPAVFADEPKRVSITTPTRLTGSEYWDDQLSHRIQHNVTESEYGSDVHGLELLTSDDIEFNTVGIGSTPEEAPGRYPFEADDNNEERAFSDPKPSAPSALGDVLDGMDGDGSESNPYVITDSHELQAMNEERDAHYTLGTNINASGTEAWNGLNGFDPIGDSSDAFTGSFDGDGYVISNVTVDRGSENNVGLFGAVDGGSITDVGVENVDINGSATVGGVVGNLDGEVTTVTVTGEVEGSEIVGGVIGLHSGSDTIGQLSMTGDIEAEFSGDSDDDQGGAGGVVGWNAGGADIIESTASGTVKSDINIIDIYDEINIGTGGLVGRHDDGEINESTASSTVNSNDHQVGGLVGWSKGDISASHATGAVIGEDDTGGLVGRTNNSVTEVDIERSSASGDVTGGSWHVGGLVGRYEDGAITISAAFGAVEGDYRRVGGLVGWNYNGDISTSYATGDVSGYEEVGGLVGLNYNDVRRSYAVGTVDGSQDVGGLLGSHYGSLAESYWDKGTTNQDDAVGSGWGATTDVAGFGETSDFDPAPEMQGRSAADTGNMSGFDFDDVWRTLEHPDEYPMLQCPA